MTVRSEIMEYLPINLSEKLNKFQDQWAPKVIAQLNNYQLKLVKIENDFVWHDHPDTDEMFMVIQGDMRIDFEDGSVHLKKGELYIIPKGKRHKPFAENECHILIIEPENVVNTGETGGNKTAENDIWI